MIGSGTNPLAQDLDHILEHTQGLWEELRNQQIFITGGTGFFGSWLLESFTWANDRLDLNAKALVLSRNPDAFARKAPHLFNHPALGFLRGDARNFKFPEDSYPYIILGATESSARLNSENPLEMFDTIVNGTRHTLEFARACRARKCLFISSGAVYGKQPAELTHIPEEYTGSPDLHDPGSAYGLGKRSAEYLCHVYADLYGIEVKIARCFAFVGPYLPLDAHFAFGNFIRDGLNGGPIVIKGDGTHYRSYLYTADLMIWLWKIFIEGENSRPYNVGSSEDLTIRQLANLVANYFNRVHVIVEKDSSAGNIPQRYVPSIVLASNELGLCQLVSLYTALKKTIQWFQGTEREGING